MINTKLFSNQVIIYGFGHILTRAISFLLLPFYSHYFLPSEYGSMTLIYTYLGFMNVIVPLGLGSAMMRYFIPADSKERIKIISSTYSIAIFSSIFFFILSLFFYETINEKIIFGPELSSDVIWYVSIILILDCLWSIHLHLIRANSRSGFFVVSNIINTICVVICNIIFVIYYDMRIEGVLLSNVIASLLSYLITIKIIIDNKFSFSNIRTEAITKLFRFALPMLGTGILSMVIELSDRSILSYLIQDNTQVGLYSINYKIGMFMLLVVMGFNMAWQPYFLDKDNLPTLPYITEYSIYIGGLVWASISFIVPYIITVKIAGLSIINDMYWPGLNIIPTIALGYFFHGIYIVSIPGMYLKDKPKFLMYIRFFGAILNIGLNFILIPNYGIEGAAFATMISFFIMAALAYKINIELLSNLNYKTNNILIVIMLLLFTFLFYNTIYSNPLLIILFFIVYSMLVLKSIKSISIS